jgi:hypothetical protein
MWKAMIFDHSLILISTQYSLQFFVADALKQLIFPLVWCGSYIQPGSKSWDMLEYAESPFPIIFGVSPMDGDFNYFMDLE